MPVLDCRVQKEDWIHEVGERNGVAAPPAEHPAEVPAADAGPWEPIVRKIVDAHEGRIDLSSSADAGTRFRVTLPVSSGSHWFK